RRVLQSQKLFAVFEYAFNRPAIRVCRQYLPCAPIKFGAVEHLVGTLPFQIVHQHDRQFVVSTCLVVESLDRLNRKSGVKPNWLNLSSVQGLVETLAHWAIAGGRWPFLPRRSSALRFLDWSTLTF